MNIGDLRENYTQSELTELEANLNPFRQFKTWFELAVSSEILEPNAMTLATVTGDGKPSARIVLLKDFDESGFLFYTNYQSNKGKQLSENPHAALVFLWKELQKQVRIEGQVEKVDPAESDAYFNSRPRGSQLGAIASSQSQVIPNREVLEQGLEQLEAKYSEGETIPRPDHWGGFRVIPVEMEFWQGRPNRLHDRLLYRRLDDGSWYRERLAP